MHCLGTFIVSSYRTIRGIYNTTAKMKKCKEECAHMLSICFLTYRPVRRRTM